MDVVSGPLSEVDHPRNLRRAIIASTIATTIEWYDFLLCSQVTGAKPEIDHRKGASVDVLRLTLDCFECWYPFGALFREQGAQKKRGECAARSRPLGKN